MDGPDFPFRTDIKLILTGTLLEERIRNICLANDAMNVALMLSLGHGQALANISPESWTAHPSSLTGLVVKIPGFSVLARALKNVRFEPISIEFSTTFDHPPEELGRDVSLVEHFYFDTIAAQFVLFFEEHYATMKDACNHDYPAMENTWKFGRRIRDAISHRGLFTINDPNFIPVVWRGYTIGPERNGTALSATLKPGDLLVLMCELERALPRPDAQPPLPDR